MSTTPITTAASTLTSLASKPATTKVGAGAKDTQMNQFLTLLTAQLKNQDPMAPTDPTQFIAQLAQFSTVEQLVQGNAKLDGMATSLSGYSLGQYAAMIGHNIGATATSVAVPDSGTPVAATFTVTNSDLTSIHVEIKDATGKVVRSVPVMGTTGSLGFNGNDDKGQRLATGTYDAALVGTDAKQTTQSAGTLSTAGVITQVLQGTGGTWQLQLADGRSVDAGAVTSLK